MATWTCKETSSLNGIRACAARGHVRETWHLADSLNAPPSHDRWWFAATDGEGRVGAFAAILGTRAHLYGDDSDAVEAMAGTLLRSQHLHASREAHRHVLFGPERVVEPFWRVFRAINRQVVGDRRPLLMYSGAEGKGSRRMTLDVASAGDQKVCVAFLADHSAEVHGLDPRRVAPEAFAREVASAIAGGRLIVGREGAPGAGPGRAMFVAEVRHVSDTVAMLDPWHVPAPFRSRKILVAGALFSALTQGPSAGKQLWALVDGEPLKLAAERAGYREALAWREIAMLG